MAQTKSETSENRKASNTDEDAVNLASLGQEEIDRMLKDETELRMLWMEWSAVMMIMALPNQAKQTQTKTTKQRRKTERKMLLRTYSSS